MGIIKTKQRIESKFILNNLGLNKVLLLTKKNGFIRSFPNRKINSLYYDNDQLICVKDNLGGITPRSKFRLRWYGDLEKDKNNLQFEKKIKIGIAGYKEIFKFDNDISIKDIDYTILGLQKISNIYDPSFLPKEFSPKLICSYERQYFENQKSVRLTFDSNIKFWSLRNKNLNVMSEIPSFSGFNILEFKFEADKTIEMLPIFRRLPYPSSRCSKYLIGQSKLYRVKYI